MKDAEFQQLVSKMKSGLNICMCLSPLNVSMKNLVEVFDENVTTMKPYKTSLL